jgi:Zn-finger domain-containing protein
MSRVKKRRKLSGVVYFAVNTRIPNMVKIGKSIDSAEKRLEFANKTNAFMVGRWSVTHKVSTNNVDRTEGLAHRLFKNFYDEESVSKEMFFIPEGITVKKMADITRSKDIEFKKVEELERRKKDLTKELDEEIKGLERDILGEFDSLKA